MKYLLYLLLLTVSLNICSCGPSKAEKEAQEKARQDSILRDSIMKDSIWWSFSTPALDNHNVKGHITKLTYDYSASNKEGKKLNRIETCEVEFDEDGMVTSKENYIPLLWFSFSKAKSFYDNGYLKEGRFYNKKNVTGQDYSLILEYDNLNRIKSMKDGTPVFDCDRQNCKLKFTYADDRNLPATIKGNITCYSIFNVTEGDYYKIDISNEFIKFDDHGNWLECLQKYAGKYYLISRKIESIPYSKD